MDKYISYLENLPADILHIAQSFAVDNMSPEIEPAHLFRALLHKSVGLVDYIEVTLDDDYYYLLDWADLHIGQCGRSAYKMKGVVLSRDSKNVVKEAVQISEQLGLSEPNLQCLLASLVTPGVGFGYEQLKTLTLRPEKIIATMQGGASPKTAVDSSKKVNSAVSLGAAGEYVTLMLDDAYVSPIVGFDQEMRSMTEMLARKDRANVLIVGDTGVGKTSLIRALVQKIKEGLLPASLESVKPYELDLIALSQGVSYKGEIEDRFRKMADGLMSMGQVVLVIENVHRLEDKQSVLNGLLPAIKKILSKNAMQMICTTTTDGFTKDIEKDKELVTYFEKMVVEEPSEALAVDIVNNWVDTYAQYHHISVAEDVPTEIVRLAKRYLAERHLPSSALDLLDRAMASVKINTELAEKENSNSNKDRQLHKEAVRDVVSKMTGIPMGNIQSKERERLSGAADILHQRVVGQSHAIKSILDAIYESRSGLNKKGQPMGSFFFLGPTGTGKTELAKALAEFLFDDETSILRFDMSEYKEEHSVALLYGAPPGYVGYEEGGLLVNQIRQHPYSVVLFDEIEKAHRSVFDLFLQILDEGKLHDRLGRVGDFSNSLIIFTSNIGSDYIFKSFGEGHVPTHDQMLEVMQGQFRPEFLARLTEIVPFSPITTEMIDRIFDIHLRNLLKTLNEQNISLKIDDTARQYVTRVGFNAHYGARPILGIIRKEIRRPLSKLIISGDVNPGDTVTMKYNEPAQQMEWEIDTPDE